MASKIKGITVQLGGDTSGLRKALAEADKALSSTQRELRDVEKGLKLDPSNTVLMAQKQELLTKAINAASGKLKELEANQEKAKKAFEANTDWEKSYAPLREQIEKAQAALNKLGAEHDKAAEDFNNGKISQEEFDKITAAAKEAENKLKELRTEEKNLESQFADGHITAEQYREYQRETERTRAQLNSLQSEFKETTAAADKTDDKIEEAADGMDKMTDSTEKADRSQKELADQLKTNVANGAKTALAAVTALTAAIGAMLKKSLDTGMEFDSAMSQVASTMGVTVDEITQLRDYAKEMGSQTSFSATQSAEALNYMALAGYDTAEQMEMLPPVLDLAASGIMDLSTASDMVTDSQTALGLSTEDTRTLIDQMAKTSSTTNTSVSQLGETLLTVGGTAKQLSGGTREMSQVLGLMADNGIKASEAGTHLRNIILAMQPTTADAAEAFEQLNLQTYDAQGNLRPMSEIFGDMNKQLSEMTSEERQNVVSKIFNKTDLTTVNALLDTSAERWEEVGTAIDNAEGAAQAMAQTQLDNLSGDITIMKSAIEGAEIALSDKFSPALREITKKGTEYVSELADTIGDKGAGAALERLPSLARSASADMHRILDKQLGDIASKVFAVENAVKAGAAAFIAYKGAMAVGDTVLGIKVLISLIKGATTATEALNAAGMANPYVLLATAVVGAGVALKSFIDTQADLIDETSETYSNLSDGQKKLIENSDDLAKTISGDIKATKDSIESVNTEVGAIEKMRDELYKLDDAENLSNEQKAKMKTLVDSLNEAMPDLNLQLDEETGHLKNQRGEIDKLIESYKQQAKAQAAQEKLVQLYKDQIDAEETLKKAHDEKAAAQEKYDQTLWKSYQYHEKYKKYIEAGNEGRLTQEMQQEMIELYEVMTANEEELEKNKDALGDLEGAYVTASAAVDSVNGSIDSVSVIAEQASGVMDKVSESSDGAAESIDSAADSVQRFGEVTLQNVNGINEMTFELNGKTVRLTEETAESIAGLIDNYDQMVESQRQAIESSVDFFGGFEADTSTTFDELYNNLNNTNYYLNDWAAGIEQLGEKGISQGLLDELKGMGLDSWKYVYALNHSTQTQLDDYSKLWDDTHKDISTTAEEQMSGLKDSTDKAIQDMIGVPKARIGEIMDKFSQIGINADEGLANGLRERFGEIEQSVTEGIDNSVIAPAENELDEHSPSKKFWDIGMNVDIGLANGIRDNSGEVAQAARDMAQDLINAVQTEIDSHSPSRVMEKLGVTVPQGLAVGVDEDTPKAINAAKNMADSIIKEVSGAGLSDIYSSEFGNFGEEKLSGSYYQPYNNYTDRSSNMTGSGDGYIHSAYGKSAPTNAVYNLMIDGRTFAQAVAPYLDIVNGARLYMSSKGLPT